MDQNVNQSASTRRFIFSDDFYDNLDAQAPQEEKVSFDVPQMPPVVDVKEKEPTEIIEEKVEEPEIPIFNFDKKEENVVPQSVIAEPITQEPTIEKQVEHIEPTIVQPNPPEEVIFPQADEVPVRVNLESISSFSSEQPKEENNFNVETGINTDLEQEIMKSRIQMESKTPIVQNNTWLEAPKEKIVYHAARRNPQTTPNNYIEETNVQTPVEPIKILPPEISPLLQPSTTTITVEDINPEIINIDDEIRKDQALQEKIDNAEVDTVIEENFDINMPAIKSDLLEKLSLKEQTGKPSILARYGEDFCSRDYITNPAIGRNEEIKQLILILLTPEKSGILVGKPGIGKTSIVEGLAYRLQRGKVPDALKGYTIVSVKTTSLLGTLPTGETRLQTLIDELKELDKIILFVDEIHMLMGATNESSLDFANMFKESLGRGSIKMIGATTNDEYERYVLRDKAFVRRFQRVDVKEPTREQTIRILLGSLPKIEKNTGAKLKYTSYIQSEIMAFIVDITTEYKRIYGIGSRYPDICLTLLAQAFSQAVFNNRKEVNILDIRDAIENSKNIYPDVIEKELINFDNKFKQLINEEKAI